MATKARVSRMNTSNIDGNSRSALAACATRGRRGLVLQTPFSLVRPALAGAQERRARGSRCHPLQTSPRADLTHIDGVLRVLATDLDPETIKPKRIYRRNRYFARNELSRLSLWVLRTVAGELLSTDEIAGRVIAAKGFALGDAILRAAIRDQVGSIVKRLHRNGAIKSIGAGRANKWKITEA
jgi:hypothetical protein